MMMMKVERSLIETLKYVYTIAESLCSMFPKKVKVHLLNWTCLRL